jgi:hypothetical protein
VPAAAVEAIFLLWFCMWWHPNLKGWRHILLKNWSCYEGAGSTRVVSAARSAKQPGLLCQVAGRVTRIVRQKAFDG